MKFSGVLFSVRSMAVSRPFYENVMGRKVALDLGINLVFEGGPTLQEDFAGLVGFPPEKTVYHAHDTELYFETDELDVDVPKVKAAGVEILHDVKEYPWGQRVFRFYDPDGHIIELADSMKAVILRFLAQGLSEEEVAQRSQHPVEFVRWCKEHPAPDEVPNF